MVKKNPNLTAEQKLVMFEDGTEPPGTSELNNEKREGSYHCVNCGIKLFDSETKYESGSGWPSFFQSIPEVFENRFGISSKPLEIKSPSSMNKRFCSHLIL